MKDFLKEIIRLWWVEGGTALKNPKSEASIKALRTILREDLELDDDFIDYIVENVTSSPTNFAPNGNTDSGINVSKTQTSVSAQIASWDDDEEITEEEEPEEVEPDEPEEDDKEDAVKDIKLNGLTDYEKDKLKKNKNETIKLPNIVLSEGSNKDATLNTSMMETAALIGTTGVSVQPFIDLLESPKVFSKIKISKKDDIEVFKKQIQELIILAKKVKDELESGLGKSGDWDSVGVGIIKSFVLPELKMKKGVPTLNENDLHDIAVAGGLAWGMKEFVDTKVNFSPVHFIHGNIRTFYAAEKARGITRNGSKDATPDAILSNKPSDTLLKSISDDSNEIVGNESDGAVKVGTDVIYIQTSLKKGVGLSQVGKFTGILRNKFGLGVDLDTAVSALLVDNLNEVEMLIREGLWDKVKNITSSIFNKVKGVVNSGLSGLKSIFSKSFKDGASIPPAAINKLISGYNLKEWTESDSNLLMEGTLNDKSKATIKAIFNKPEIAYANLAKDVTAFEAKLAGIGNLGHGIVTHLSSQKRIPVSPGDIEPGQKIVFNLMANMATIKMVNDLIEKSSKLKSIIGKLIAEMLFGATNQPVFKVYGKMERGDRAYSFLGTASTVERRFTDSEVNFELIGIDIHPQSGSSPKGLYYVIEIFLLQEIADSGKFYVNVRTGTNSSSKPTQVYEGKKIIGSFDIDMKLEDIMK